jgi:fructokinase
MKSKDLKQSVVCFGEILWDVLPMERKPGGAPMNVAYHLHKLGIQCSLVSALGDDEAGRELVNFLKSIELSTDYIQVTENEKTSQVLATVNDNHEVSYEILYPVAWDKIIAERVHQQLVTNSGAFVYGSLASRDAMSKETLFRMLDFADYKVFDVNLREPHYTKDLITRLLERADMVKLNMAELMLLSGWYNPGRITETEAVETLLTRFSISELLITKGVKGASYYTKDFRFDYPAYTIEVADTIGSGDAFLAAFLAMKLKNRPLEDTLDYAVAMGAFITSHSGACPPYVKSDLDGFIWRKKIMNEKSRQIMSSR